MSLLKQSTARDKMVFMTDSSDHITGKTGLTLTITASKNGAAFASITPTVTERGNGWYSLSLTSSHTDTLGDLALHVTGTAADPSDLVWEIVSLLPGDAVTISGTLSTIDAIWAKIQKWLRFVLRGDAGLATDQSTELSEINQDMGSGSGSFSNINDSLEANQTNIGANGANLYVNINSGAITSSVLDVTALLEIRNKFLILQDTLNAPTVTSTTVVLNGSNAANDDAYNGMLLANFNAAGELKQVRTVTDYDNATLTVTVDRPWADRKSVV